MQNRNYISLDKINFVTKENETLSSERKKKVEGAHLPLLQNTHYAKDKPELYSLSANINVSHYPIGNYVKRKLITTLRVIELYQQLPTTTKGNTKETQLENQTSKEKLSRQGRTKLL